MDDIEIVRLSQQELDANLEQIVDVYAAALGEDRAVTWQRMTTEVLPRHRTREGFRFLVARDDGGVVGMAYGYVGARGQWWTERVAAAMSAQEQARWLDPPHFEVVELHVLPERQRQGIGRALLTQLLSGLDVPFALLSTDEGNSRARRFYATLGWKEIVSNVALSSPRGPFVVLARELDERSIG